MPQFNIGDVVKTRPKVYFAGVSPGDVGVITDVLGVYKCMYRVRFFKGHIRYVTDIHLLGVKNDT